MIATGFVQNGAKVYISSRTAKACDDVATELTALGPGTCVSLPADLSSFDECQRVKKDIEDKEGVLNVLVNNSGRTYGAPLAEHTDQAWDVLMTLNVRRVFTLVQALTPLLEKGSKASGVGRIINVSGRLGWRRGCGLGGQLWRWEVLTTDRDDVRHQHNCERELRILRVKSRASPVRSLSLTALNCSMSRHLALNLGPRGINVNTVALGAFPTDMLTETLEQSIEEIASHVPMRRLGEASDIAGTCLYLASRAGAWTTG